MSGKLIVFEGTDGSGKSTQFNLFCERLNQLGKAFHHVQFPQYKEPSSTLIRMYLGGEFGSSPSDVNAYAASSFYAVDRYASFKKFWGKDYEQGALILADRYTTSNAVHQASKLVGEERSSFLQWLYDFEFNKLALPKPDAVIYLDMPTEQSVINLRSREQSTNTHADIHEVDTAYLASCREAALSAAPILGWNVISCVKDGTMRSIQDIHEEIWNILSPIL